MRFRLRRLLPLSARIALTLISFGVFSDLFGLDAPRAAAATATITTLKTSPNPSIYAQGLTFTATVTGTNPTGNVTFTETSTGSTFSAGVSGGVATTSVYPFSAGSHQFTATYSGDSNYSASTSAPLTQVIKKSATSVVLTSSLNPSLSTQNVTFYAAPSNTNATFAEPLGGTVTFTLDGTPQPPVTFDGYSAVFSTSSLAAGSHTLSAVYNGDINSMPSTSTTLTQVVNAHLSTQYVSPSGSDNSDGSQAHPKQTIQATINTTINGDTVIVEDGTYTGPGDVDLDFGGRNITVTSQNGAASTIIDCGGTASASHRGFYLHSGETAAVISGFTIQNGNESSGGGIYCGGIGAAIQNCILKNNTANFYGGGFDNYSTAGSTVSVTNCVFTGNTTGLFGGGLYSYNNTGTTAVTNCTFTGNASTRSGTDNGGGIYSQPSGVITLTNDILYGDTGGELGNQYGSGSQPTYYTITNCDIQGSYAGGGNINADPYFYSSPADLHLQAGSPCLGAGTASGAPATTLDGRSRPTPPSIGAYEAAATGPSAAATTLTSSLNPATAGQSVTFTAKVAAGGGAPKGTINFLMDGNTQAHVPLSSGTASYSTSSLTSGSHSIVATYSGDSFYAAGTSAPLTQTINPISTVTAITSTTNPSQYGLEAIFTVTITGSSTAGNGPTGSVTLTDAATGTVLVTRYISGVTTVNLGYYNLSIGSHQLVAAYSGDKFYGASTSASLTQTVTQAMTTATLVSSLNPSIASQSVTFTATVATQSTAIPTGTVTFSVDGVTQPATALSQSLTATYTTSALTAGAHTITAAYSGDANFTSSASPSFTQTVNAHVNPQYVSPSGSDSNPGTLSLPKLTIQAAMSVALTGDTVMVGDGTYTGPGNVDLGFGGKNLTVMSQNGATKTIIDCQGSATNNHRGFYIDYNATAVVISGLTIQNGYEGTSSPGSANYPGGGILSYSGMTIQNCILKNNMAGVGGGLYSSLERGSAQVLNCVFISNAAGIGGGLDLVGEPTSVTNCTITGNTATGTGTNAPGGGIASLIYGYGYPPNSGGIVLTNDIIYGDKGGEVVNQASGGPSPSQPDPTAASCDIQGGFAGTGNIDTDPLFILPPFMGALPDLHLQYNSPCAGMGIAAGAPTTAIDGQTRPTPPSIGAYEVTLPSFLLNDTNSGITYNGGWFYNSGRGLGDLRDDVHATVNNGDSLSYSFLGTGVSYLTETNSDEGMVAVYIDGTLKQTVNCATPARQVQQSVYSISGLAPGLHSIKLVKVSGTVMVVDGLRITTAPGTVPMNIINDTSSALQYNGPNGANSWFHSSNRNFGDVGDDVHAATANGSGVLYSFNGTAVSYVTETNSDEGSVDVVLDNVLQTTVSCVTATRKTGQTVWSKSGLPPGPHTLLLIKHDGQYMLLDALLVTPSPTVINDTNPGLNYSAGGWFYNYGRSFGDLSDDVHATVYNGDAVSYSFTGTSISYLTETNPDEGTVAVYIDGVLNQTVSCVTPTRQVQQTVFSVSGLTPGAHTLTLVKTGGMVMVLDGLSFQ